MGRVRRSPTHRLSVARKSFNPSHMSSRCRFMIQPRWPRRSTISPLVKEVPLGDPEVPEVRHDQAIMLRLAKGVGSQTFSRERFPGCVH